MKAEDQSILEVLRAASPAIPPPLSGKETFQGLILQRPCPKRLRVLPLAFLTRCLRARSLVPLNFENGRDTGHGKVSIFKFRKFTKRIKLWVHW